jgi:hypothetical protein
MKFKTFKDFYKYKLKSHGKTVPELLANKKSYLCFHCGGQKKVKQAYSYYDYTWTKCSTCDGEGSLTKEQLQSMMNIHNEEIDRKQLEETSKNAMRRNLKEKLTVEEINFIQKYGI